MQNEKILEFQPLWGNWNVVNFIADKGLGKIYGIERKINGRKQEAIVKHISIPFEGQIEEAIAFIGKEEQLLNIYFEEIIEKLVSEIEELYKLKGHVNIIGYEEHLVVKEKMKWEIFIRMEKAMPLMMRMFMKPLTVGDVIKIGIDICTALENCHQYDIIHKDIKERNIFISENEKYKLGAFEIGRNINEIPIIKILEEEYSYAAPEVLKSKEYNHTVDIYSLGFLLYKLLNNGREPYIPMKGTIDKEIILKSYEDRKNGEILRRPIAADNQLGDIILKACQYYPANRYSTAKAFRIELENLYDSNFVLDKILEMNIEQANFKFDGRPGMGGPGMGGPGMGGPGMGRPRMVETEMGKPRVGRPGMERPLTEVSEIGKIELFDLEKREQEIKKPDTVEMEFVSTEAKLTLEETKEIEDSKKIDIDKINEFSSTQKLKKFSETQKIRAINDKLESKSIKKSEGDITLLDEGESKGATERFYMKLGIENNSSNSVEFTDDAAVISKNKNPQSVSSNDKFFETRSSISKNPNINSKSFEYTSRMSDFKLLQSDQDDIKGIFNDISNKDENNNMKYYIIGGVIIAIIIIVIFLLL